MHVQRLESFQGNFYVDDRTTVLQTACFVLCEIVYCNAVVSTSLWQYLAGTEPQSPLRTTF